MQIEAKSKGEVKKALISLYKEFCGYVVETRPNYVDQDFSFEDFMNYLEIEESDELRKAM